LLVRVLISCRSIAALMAVGYHGAADDQGYGISGTFGGVIPTPAMDRIAAMGLRYVFWPKNSKHTG
jgi:hypothetical protein